MVMIQATATGHHVPPYMRHSRQAAAAQAACRAGSTGWDPHLAAHGGCCCCWYLARRAAAAGGLREGSMRALALLQYELVPLKDTN
jgi:hypothetical protein